jgi:hypothetical protein
MTYQQYFLYRILKIIVQKDTTYETFFVLLTLKSEVIFRLSTKKC